MGKGFGQDPTAVWQESVVVVIVSITSSGRLAEAAAVPVRPRALCVCLLLLWALLVVWKNRGFCEAGFGLVLWSI